MQSSGSGSDWGDTMKKTLRRICAKILGQAAADRGVNMVEYALIGALLGLGALTGMARTAKSMTKAYKTLSSDLKNDVPKTPKKA